VNLPHENLLQNNTDNFFNTEEFGTLESSIELIKADLAMRTELTWTN
jgi:hypothetical protein